MIWALVMAIGIGIGGTGSRPEPASPATPPAQVSERDQPTDAQHQKWVRVIDAAEKFGEREMIRAEKYVRQYRHGHYPARTYDSGQPNSTNATETGNNENNVSANFQFAHVNMMKALLHTNPPVYEIDPRDAELASGGPFEILTQVNPANLMAPPLFKTPDDAKRQFADALETVATHSYERTGTTVENEVALFDTITRGVGITKQSFDAERGIDRVDCIKSHELYIDPHARHSIRQAAYVVHTVIYPIEQARRFFATKMQGAGGGVQGAEQTNGTWLSATQPADLEANFTTAEIKGMTGDSAKSNAAEATEKDLYKFYEIWNREVSPPTLCYYAWGTKARLWEGPWPFQLQIDDFPISVCAFNRCYVQMGDAFCDLEVVDGLEKLVEEMIRFHKASIKRGIAKKVLYDANMLGAEEVKALENQTDYATIPISLKGRSIRDVFMVAEFNGKDDPAYALYEQMKQIMDEITGMDEIIRGGEQQDLTATHARLVESMQNLRTGLKMRSLDQFLEVQLEQRIQIARQLMDPEKVKKLAGDKAYWLWILDANNPDDFLNEYTVRVAAGSTGQLAKQDRMQRMDRFYQRATGENAVLMQRGLPPGWDTDAIMEEVVREDNIRNPDRFRLAPPPMMIPGMMPPGVQQGAGGGVPPPGVAMGPGAAPQGGPPPAPPMPPPNAPPAQGGPHGA